MELEDRVGVGAVVGQGQLLALRVHGQVLLGEQVFEVARLSPANRSAYVYNDSIIRHYIAVRG